MKIAAVVLISGVIGASALAQSPSVAQPQSVWLEDYTDEELKAAVAAGKTTLIYNGGATHGDGPTVVVGKHQRVARYVAQRVAEELGNALVMPINPYAPSPYAATSMLSVMRVSEETYGLVVKDAVNAALSTLGFKQVLLMTDHNPDVAKLLQIVASRLDLDWKPRGHRVHFIDLHGAGGKLIDDYLTTQNAPARHHISIDDAAELVYVQGDKGGIKAVPNPEVKWVRQDKVPPEDRKFVTMETGKALVDFKINAVLQQIRNLPAKE